MDDESYEQIILAARRRWILVWIGVSWLLGACVAWFLGRALLWREVQHAAARHGVELEGCGLELDWGSLHLVDCRFRAPAEGAPGVGLGALGLAARGSMDEIAIELSGMRLERLVARELDAAVVGKPELMMLARRLRELSDVPLVLEQARVAWDFDGAAPPEITLSRLDYVGAEGRLSSDVELIGGLRGSLRAAQGALEGTLGEAPNARASFRARPFDGAAGVELSVDLRDLPVRDLEGPWLELTPVLRAVTVHGRIAARVPFGLTLEPPTGEVALTLDGLAFPIPRELEGIVYGGPAKLSGKLKLSRLLDRATSSDLRFTTGALDMHGSAALWLEESAVAFQASLGGPLSCDAIIGSAERAHSGSPLARWAARVARRTLRGSVHVVAALSGKTPHLRDAKVLTSIGVGCGLEPLPIDASFPRELLSRLPEAVLRALPSAAELPTLGELPFPPPIVPRRPRAPQPDRGDRAPR